MDNVIKFSIYSEKDSLYLKDRLYDRWKDKFSVVVSGKFWLDVNGPKSEKGNAVRIIQEMNGISPDETVVFGDNFNDISMFRRAKQSYASILSHEDVKAAAAFEVASYEENGVLHELERILEEIKMQ